MDIYMLGLFKSWVCLKGRDHWTREKIDLVEGKVFWRGLIML
jgi:hypothetical protein